VNVLFAPYAESNPYQANLRDGLAAQGDTVEAAVWDPFLPLVRSYLRARDTDVVHLHWLHEYFQARSRPVFLLRAAVFLLQVWLLRLLGLRVVWTLHNLTAHEFPFPAAEARLKRVFVQSLCDAVVVHCEAARESAVDTYGLDDDARSKIHVVPHGHYRGNYPSEGSRGAARDSLGLPADATVLLYFGQIRPYKNVPVLIETFAEVSEPGTWLVVAGNPRSESIRAKVASLVETTDRVTAHLDYVPDEDVGTYMHASDAVVLPFRDVLTSGSAVLAMSYGRAVVAPAIGCLPALVGPDGGALYDPDRPDGLADALRSLESRSLDANGQRNRERIAACDWEPIAERTAAVYRAARGAGAVPEVPESGLYAE